MVVLAVGCHPDDIEFMMSGTLFLLGEAGCSLHYLTIANGDMGSMSLPLRRIASVRRRESMRAAEYLGAIYHESVTGDIEVFYRSRLIRRVAAVVRRVKPDVMLVQSLEDYMEDHMTSARLAVTAAFVRGMPNYRTIPPAAPIDSDVMVYHSLPHTLGDQMRRPIVPEFYLDVSSVMDRKERMLAMHESQKSWLDKTQGFDSYLATMRGIAAEVGRMSGRFPYAEAWRRHSHVGFRREDGNPLAELLGARVAMHGGGGNP
jgi:LmbE family N-acetylglucosaminyl deacetylase